MNNKEEIKDEKVKPENNGPKEPKAPREPKAPKEPKEPKAPKEPKKKVKKNPPKSSVNNEGSPKDLKKQEGRARFMQMRNEARAKYKLPNAYSQEQIDAEMDKA